MQYVETPFTQAVQALRHWHKRYCEAKPGSKEKTLAESEVIRLNAKVELLKPKQ